MPQAITRASLLLGLSLSLLFGGAPGGLRAQERAADLREEVADTERAFAQTMADRDHAAFTSFLSEEAVFFGDSGVLRGRGAVAEGWRPLFEGPDAPFSWAPEAVEVLASGTLAFSSGPVFNPRGERIGTFNSVWRLHEDGKWRIVFDKGCPPCLASPGGEDPPASFPGCGVAGSPMRVHPALRPSDHPPRNFP